MRETFAQHAGLVWGLGFALAVLILALALRARRLRRARAEAVGKPPFAPPAALDATELLHLLQDAEKSGARDKLPGLYLSLAQCRLAAGDAPAAADLLRKSVRVAAEQRDKDIHARARVALGDIAHRGGDLTTACEHWQIARALFFELKQPGNHAQVETRMLKNGCPTDWVLTDF